MPEVRGALAKRAGRWTGALLAITVLTLGGWSSVRGQNAPAAQANASLVAPKSPSRFAIYGQARSVQKLARSSSGGLAIIVAEHPSEASTALDQWAACIGGSRPQKAVPDPLMVAFTMVVLHVLGDRVSE